ncbi:MAG: hypothetical protein Q4G49_10885 [Paracoccus sp. (in: a-proteobacteria)]|nr:hypothetical protein [Paracoccus sp. (in: a-proteobacteria)]
MTPGPWKRLRQERYGHRAVEFYDEIWDENHNVLVEEVTRAHADGGSANLRFIAAAPDLATKYRAALDALDAIRALIVTPQKENDNG